MKHFLKSRYLLLSLLVSMSLSFVVCVSLGFAFIPFWTKGVIRSTHILADLLELKPQDDGRENFERIIRFRSRLNYNRMGIWLVGTTADNPIPHVLIGTDAPPESTKMLSSLPQEKDGVKIHNPYFFRAFHSFLRLPTEKPRWLWFSSDVSTGSFGILRVLAVVIFLVISATASLAAYLVLQYLFRSRARLAHEVIGKISYGNLKARLPYDSPESTGLFQSFNKMADDIERMVGELKAQESLRQRLVAELSHDLRTPLTAIRIALDSKFIDAEKDNLKAKHLLDLARRELSYLQKLLEYLFAAAKSDVPLIPVRMEQTELAALLNEEIERFKALPDSKSGKEISWNLVVETEKTEVKADRSMTSRLFRNILENARRYATRSVRVKVLEEEGELLISIFNDGPPIDLEKFQSTNFQMIDKLPIEKAARADTSLGLGSQIISAIVDLHDWEMSVEARKDGTEVMLRILR